MSIGIGILGTEIRHIRRWKWIISGGKGDKVLIEKIFAKVVKRPTEDSEFYFTLYGLEDNSSFYDGYDGIEWLKVELYDSVGYKLEEWMLKITDRRFEIIEYSESVDELVDVECCFRVSNVEHYLHHLGE